MNTTEYLSTLQGVVGVAKLSATSYRLDLVEGGSRLATESEALPGIKGERIDAINAECRTRLLARYGSAEEQVSRAIGIYGAAEQAAMQAGIAATIDASNAASNEVLAAEDIASVGAVSVSWPEI
jgi:hypothetical protein